MTITPDIIVEIEESHEKVRTALKDALIHASMLGFMLDDVKDGLDRLAWRKWLKKNTKITPYAANNYRKVNKHFSVPHFPPVGECDRVCCARTCRTL